MDKKEYEKIIQDLKDIQEMVKKAQNEGRLKDPINQFPIILAAIMAETKFLAGLDQNLHNVLQKSDKISKLAFIVGGTSLCASIVSLVISLYMTSSP